MFTTITDFTAISDEALLTKIAAGNTSAFNELYKRYGQVMFGYFFKMLWKNKEFAEDQTQELFLKVLKHAKDFDTAKSFKTWLFSIANNMCKNEYRKEEMKSRHASLQPPADGTPVDKRVDLKRFSEAVTDCINRLKEDKRSLFILRFQEHLTVPQISVVLDLPEGTIKSRLFYLLKEMKEELIEFKTLNIYP